MMIPARLSTAQLVDVLRDMAELVDTFDSFEGTVTYTALGDSLDDLGPDEWEVSGLYRTGNRGGQGGIRLIGDADPWEP